MGIMAVQINRLKTMFEWLYIDETWGWVDLFYFTTLLFSLLSIINAEKVTSKVYLNRVFSLQ